MPVTYAIGHAMGTIATGAEADADHGARNHTHDAIAAAPVDKVDPLMEIAGVAGVPGSLGSVRSTAPGLADLDVGFYPVDSHSECSGQNSPPGLTWRAQSSLAHGRYEPRSAR